MALSSPAIISRTRVPVIAVGVVTAFAGTVLADAVHAGVAARAVIIILAGAVAVHASLPRRAVPVVVARAGHALAAFAMLPRRALTARLTGRTVLVIALVRVALSLDAMLPRPAVPVVVAARLLIAAVDPLSQVPSQIIQRQQVRVRELVADRHAVAVLRLAAFIVHIQAGGKRPF